MCLLAFAWKADPRWRLLLAGNRDEYHDRPSAPLQPWPDAGLIAGRDLQAGGTWLGVTPDGRCASVTNVRDPSLPTQGRSRGGLAVGFLAGTASAAAHAQALETQVVDYRPFNLLLFDTTAAVFLRNQPRPHRQMITPGIHGLSNADLGTPWPKTVQLTRRLAAFMEGPATDIEPLFAALADVTPAADDALPDTGVGRALERRLSPAFICDERYGTRCSTVVALDHAGRGYVIERRFGPRGVLLGERREELGPC